MTPAERSVLEDKLRETGLPEDQIIRLMAADELFYRAREVASHLGGRLRGELGSESTHLAVSELVAVINKVAEKGHFEPTPEDYRRWLLEKQQLVQRVRASLARFLKESFPEEQLLEPKYIYEIAPLNQGVSVDVGLQLTLGALHAKE